MLRLLLDEHVPTPVGPQVRAHNPVISIQSLQEWEGGIYLRQADALILSVAHQQRLTFFTYDQKTIPRLLKDWAEEGIGHSGVILADRRTLAQNDIAGLVRRILAIWHVRGTEDWRDYVVYLYPQEQ